MIDIDGNISMGVHPFMFGWKPTDAWKKLTPYGMQYQEKAET